MRFVLAVLLRDLTLLDDHLHANTQDAHPIVIKWALTTANNAPNAYKCFWYQQKVSV